MNDLLVLATLLDGPKHGYAIKKQTGLISGRPAMHNNLVYPLLRSFVAKGWVTRRESAGQRGQTRQMYSLTGPGRRALVESLSEFGEKDIRSPEAFRLRVGFFEVLNPGVRAGILEKRKSFLEAQNGKLARLEDSMDLGRYGGETVHFVRLQTRGELDWIEHLQKISSRREQRRNRRRALS